MVIYKQAWQTALQFVADYGPFAEDRALARLRELCVRGDLVGCRALSGVLAAMNQLRSVERRRGDALH